MKNTTKQPNNIRRFQRGIYMAAKNSPDRRFGVLYDKVYRKDVLLTAWSRVRSGGKAAGVDSMTVAYIEMQIGTEQFLNEIEQELRSESYRADIIRRVEIPKSDGGKRPLGIPTLKDKVVQMAVKIAIEPLFECDFCDCSYGFRPKRSNKQAANEVHRISNTHKWVVDVDLKSYFDTIDHDILLTLLRKRISDKRILAVIRQWLKASTQLKDGRLVKTTCGVPQGGVLSPLLSNIVLHEIDKQWNSNRSVKLVRFADDMVFMCVSEAQANWVYRQLYKQITELKLTMNDEKTKIRHLREGFDFLGFTYKEAYSRKHKRFVRVKFPRAKKIKEFQQEIKAKLKDYILGTNLRAVIATINGKVRGWAEYFKIGNSYKAACKLDRYLCDQLRLYWRKCKHRKDIQGTRRWKNAYFYEQGLLYMPELIRNNGR